MKHQAHKLAEMVGEQKPPKNGNTRFLAITSGKGGVGKTTVSANLAWLLAKQGYKVGLFDADIGLANLDVMLGVKTARNILHLLKGECAIDEILVEVDTNLWLVPGESGNEILRFHDQFLMERFYNEIKKLDFLDYLIIDTGAGIADHVQMFLDAADEVLVVPVPDPAAITDAYAMIKILSTKRDRLFMLLNQVKSTKEGESVFIKIHKVASQNLPGLSLEAAGFLPRDSDVEKSVRQRALFSKTVPNAAATMRLDEISKQLVARMEHKMLQGKEESGFGRFFKRLLNQF